MDRYDGEARRLIPSGADIFDAHLHLGNDIDGMVGDYDELEARMAKYGISRAFMFCLDEPDRHPGFRAANDRTLAFAERSKDERAAAERRLDERTPTASEVGEVWIAIDESTGGSVAASEVVSTCQRV